MSKSYANSILILGHTTSGMGERVLATKFKGVMEQLGFKVEPTIDLFELMGQAYDPLARLNYDLAKNGYSILEEIQLPDFRKIREKIVASLAEIFLILSWSTSLAALLALGIHRTRFTVAKLYAHHRNERVLTSLYEPTDLLITESLLANERGIAYGIPAGKMLYLPHYYPSICEQIVPSRAYVEKLAHGQGKTIHPKTVIIGTVSRLEYGKNCEFAIEAVRRLALKGIDVVLVLKGDFPEENLYPEFRSRLSKMLAVYRSEPWLLWDSNPTLFPNVLYEYASFDICLHLSGAEGGSHVIVECLGLGKPAVLLDGSTNPYLFREGAFFVKSEPQMRAALLCFNIPQMEDLMEKLEEIVLDSQKQKAMGKQARMIAEKRFHPHRTKERLSLLFEAAQRPMYKEIEALYDQDRKLYGI